MIERKQAWRGDGLFGRLSLDSLSKRLKSQLSFVATVLRAVSGANRAQRQGQTRHRSAATGASLF
jgi:hypothetical protein